MPSYRVEAAVRDPHGSTKILSKHRFEAGTLGEAETVADEWAAASGIDQSKKVCVLRVVQAEMILAQRPIFMPVWQRSSWAPRPAPAR
jgi:hypothetical protein